MGRLFYVLFYLILFCFSTARGDVGCAKDVNSTALEVIYSVRVLPNVSGFENYNGPIFYNDIGYPGRCPSYSFSQATVINTRCCIEGNCNSSYRKINFTPLYTNCPLDDYVAWLLLPIGIFGFLFIRIRQFVNH